jgi:two-component system response regulator AtoC
MGALRCAAHMPKVLVVDRDPIRAEALMAALAQLGHGARLVNEGPAALSILEEEVFDLVCADADELDGQGNRLVDRLAEKWPDLPFVAFAPPSDDGRARVLRAGAADLLSTPISAEEVGFVVRKVVSSTAAGAERPPRPARRATELLGESDGIRGVRELVKRTAAGTATTLIRGETGTGKELVARAVHSHSLRRDRPFVKIDCASLPDTLLESELFGYERGAFTGAASRKLGRIELAEGGTLFLDEIGEISPVIQAKLLRLLQDREFERLGSRITQRIDLRFVLATHRDLEAMVDNGTFRHDLFQRFNVVTIWIPPLRSRRNDIEVLAFEFARRFGAENGKRGIEFTVDALKLLRAQRWPGNVRQLENFVERAVVLADAARITAKDVERHFVQKPDFLTERTQPVERGPETVKDQADAAPLPLADIVRRAERDALVAALERAAGNRTLAARVLGVSRATFYNKLKELGIA